MSAKRNTVVSAGLYDEKIRLTAMAILCQAAVACPTHASDLLHKNTWQEVFENFKDFKAGVAKEMTALAMTDAESAIVNSLISNVENDAFEIKQIESALHTIVNVLND